MASIKTTVGQATGRVSLRQPNKALEIAFAATHGPLKGSNFIISLSEAETTEFKKLVFGLPTDAKPDYRGVKNAKLKTHG